MCAGVETWMFVVNKDNKSIMRIEYVNILNECILNLFVLYYFISVNAESS